ncbi:hypothetical protein ES703_81339 [subsurface metagenome]
MIASVVIRQAIKIEPTNIMRIYGAPWTITSGSTPSSRNIGSVRKIPTAAKNAVKAALITKPCCAARLAISSSPAPTKRAIIALIPIVRPIFSDSTVWTTAVPMPTPATGAAVPSLPTAIRSMVGAKLMKALVTSIGQERDKRLPIIPPFVQSRSYLAPLPPPLPPLGKPPSKSSIAVSQSFPLVRPLNLSTPPAQSPRQPRIMNR